jgi:hypothetical protein
MYRLPCIASWPDSALASKSRILADGLKQPQWDTTSYQLSAISLKRR